ncbi:MAG: hypothetical protein NTZ74_13545 [Chloroflexi bacterium]|nr:hypothetical protein [Chloroflexota bacterium]
MSKNLTQKDWQLISAYLDDQLPVYDHIKTDSRLENDPPFRQVFFEVAYTRQILRSLPAKRAPRNLTLSQKIIQDQPRRAWFQPAMSFISATAAIVLVVLFTTSTIIPGFQSAKSVAPGMNSQAEFSAESNQKGAAENVETTPEIILWNPSADLTEGKGGGANPSGMSGTDQSTQSSAPAPIEQDNQEILSPLAAQTMEEQPTDSTSEYPYDPSTLILGVPEPGTGGKIIDRMNNTIEGLSPDPNDTPTSAPWMIGLAALSLISGLIALFLRRK